jgi:type IV pilus assembly protein PilO
VNMTTKRITAVAAVGAVLILAIWYLALFSPQSKNLKAAHKAYTAAEQQVNALRTQVAGLQALERQVPHDKAVLASLNQAIPSTPDLKDVLDQLHALAVSTGVELTSVGPSVSPNANSSGGISSITMTLNLTGTYPQVTNFLKGLTTMPRTVVINSVSIGGGSAGSLSTSLSTYIYYAA